MRLINLLPPDRQEALRYEAIFYSTLRAVIIAAMLFGLVLVVQIGTRFYLAYQNSNLSGEVETLKAQINTDDATALKQEIRINNALMNDYNTQVQQIPQWSTIVVEVAKAVPAGVVINNLSADLETLEITVQGQAETREAVIQLYNNLIANTEYFNEVDYPLENVTKPTDVTFRYTFFVNKEVILP